MEAPAQTKPLSRTGRTLVYVALGLGASAVGLAWLLGASGLTTAIIAASFVFALGLILWWYGTDASRGWDDLGRSLVLSAVLALVGGIVQNELDKRSERRALQLSLSQAQDLSGVDLSDRPLEGFRLQKKKLVKADLEGAELDDADLFDAELGEANLRGADLQGADLREAGLEKADLRGANLHGADLRRAHLEVANLAGADLSEAKLDGAFLASACMAPGTDDGRAVATDLSDADLTGADLHGAVLTGANLRGAKLESDLRPARLVGVGLKGAMVDGRTVVPDDFDRKSAFAGKPPAYIPNATPPKPPPAVSPVRPLHTVQAVEVVDGDTLRLEGVTKRTRHVFGLRGRARLIGINAPPPDAPNGIAARATASLRDELQGLEVKAELVADEPDKFGRRLVRVWLDDGTLLNEQLVEDGYATVLPHPASKSIDARLLAAQTRAKQRGVGVWQRCG